MTPETLDRANFILNRIKSIKGEISHLSDIRRGIGNKSLGIVEKDRSYSHPAGFFNTALVNISEQAVDIALCAMLNDLESQLFHIKEEFEAL